MCVLIFSKNLSATFLILRRNGRDMSKKYVGLHAKYPLFLLILTKLAFSRQIFRKILKYQISLKSVQLAPSCFMRTDRRTDMRKLIIAFRKFAKAPKNASQVANKVQTCLSVCLNLRDGMMNMQCKNSCTTHTVVSCMLPKA